jgi:hypothetical protein
MLDIFIQIFSRYNYILAFLLTQWSRIRLEKLVKKFPTCYGSDKFTHCHSTPSTLKSYEKWFFHLAKILWQSVNLSLLSFFNCIGPRLVTLLKIIDVPHKILIILILLLVSSSPILAFRNPFFLFLKSLIAANLTFFRLSMLLWFASCNHWIFAYFLWSTKRKNSSWFMLLQFVQT